VYRNSKGEEFVGSFHGSAAAAAKGSNGVKPIAVVETTTTEPTPEPAPVETPKAEMKFSKVDSEDGARYVAEGKSFRYAAEREGKEWKLTIRRLETVAGIRVAVSGHAYNVTRHDTLSLCKAVAGAFEDLGDDYRSADHGHAERTTTATLRAYGYGDAEKTNNEGETLSDTTSRIYALLGNQNPGTGATIGESVPLNSLADFERVARKKLGDLTEVTGAELDGCDWVELFSDMIEESRAWIPAFVATLGPRSRETWAAMDKGRFA
jgi:hypothetical protein